MELTEEYKQLTNIDIEEQRQIWDERGKGFYGEYLLFCELYKVVAGNCKILMNLIIPAEFSGTTEIDLLLIHETGLYVFEIKNYKGTIYGKDTDRIWTQYFRTSPNYKFKNPVEQNGYHIRALKKLFPDIPIQSLIVFTSHECNIKVNNSNQNIDICLLQNVKSTLSNRFSKSDEKLSMDNIDEIFRKLLIYSPMQKKVSFNKNTATFYSWIQPVISKLEAEKSELEREKNRWALLNENLKKAKTKGIMVNIFIAVVCIVISVFAIFAIRKEYDNDIAALKQNFLHVDEIGNDYIDSLNSYVEISNVSLSPLSDDAVSFTARIAVKNDTYGILLTEDSKYIVMTDSGKVFEYNVFGDHLPYQPIANQIGKGIREYGDLAEAQFFGISNTDDISYIKLTNVEMFKLDIRRAVVKDNLEIELYLR